MSLDRKMYTLFKSVFSATHQNRSGRVHKEENVYFCVTEAFIGEHKTTSLKDCIAVIVLSGDKDLILVSMF